MMLPTLTLQKGLTGKILINPYLCEKFVSAGTLLHLPTLMVMLSQEITTECGGRPGLTMEVSFTARELMPIETGDFTGTREAHQMTSVQTLIMAHQPFLK